MQPSQTPDVLAAHIEAINAHDADAIMATFAADAFVNDDHPEFVGTDAIRALVEHGDTIVRLRSDGDYDKTGLPDSLILTGYVHVGAGRIERLIIIHNRDAEA